MALAAAGGALAAALALVGRFPQRIAAQLHQPTLPAPTGPFSVGRMTLEWIDSTRVDPWASGPLPRRLLCYVWYPRRAEPDTSQSPYFPDLAPLAARFSSSDRRVLGRLRSHAHASGAVIPDPIRLPVLLFSPGANLSTLFYTGLGEEMASLGYVVVGIEHAHEGRGQVFRDGYVAVPEYLRHMPGTGTAVEDETRFFHRWAELRARDAGAALEHLSGLRDRGDALSGRLDLARIGFIGHSIGGLAATHALRHDPRILAAADLDGLLLVTRADLQDPTSTPLARPFLFMGQTDHADPQEALLQTAEGPRYRIVIPGASHMSFSDLPFWTAGHRSAKVRRLDAMRAYLQEFFDRHVRGREARRIDLLPHNHGPDSAAAPDIRFRQP